MKNFKYTSILLLFICTMAFNSCARFQNRFVEFRDDYVKIYPPYSASVNKAKSKAIREYSKMKLSLESSKFAIQIKEDSTSYSIEYIPMKPADSLPGGVIVIHFMQGAIIIVEKSNYEIRQVYITR